MFLQDLQATFRVISCNPSTWLGWIVARQPPLSQCFVHFYLTTLGHGGSAFPVSLTNHTDLCAGFDRAGMVTLIVKLSSHRLHAQMRETKCLVGGGVTHSCMGFWDVKSRGPARFRHQLDQAKGDLEKWSLFFLLSKWPWQHVETCWKNMLSCYPLVNKGGNGKPIMCRCLT